VKHHCVTLHDLKAPMYLLLKLKICKLPNCCETYFALSAYAYLFTLPMHDMTTNRVYFSRTKSFGRKFMTLLHHNTLIKIKYFYQWQLVWLNYLTQMTTPLGNCDIDFFNFCHWKVQNFEILNLSKRSQNFAVIFWKYWKRNQKSTKYFKISRKPRVIPMKFH